MYNLEINQLDSQGQVIFESTSIFMKNIHH